MQRSKTVRRRLWLFIVIAIAITITFVTMVAFSAQILILDNPRPSDAIVVWGGDDLNYRAGLRLIRTTGAKYMFVCLEQNDFDISGSELRHDREFVARSAGAFANNIDICVGNSDDILLELNEKLVAARYRSVLIIAPEQYSRADYIEAKKRLPNYSWSVSATPEPHFSRSWWQSRGKTKNLIFGLERLASAL